MQSIYLFLRASRSRVEDWLTRQASLGAGGRQWSYPAAAHPRLRIELCTDAPWELTPEVRRALSDRLGPGPFIQIVADVSRAPGASAEVLPFTIGCLEEHGGLAMDDHSDELWSLEEIAAPVAGRRRFAVDY